MKNNTRTRKSKSSSRTSRRKRKAKKVASGIFIEILGFVAMIALFVFARTLMQPEDKVVTESITNSRTANVSTNELSEPMLETQIAASAEAQAFQSQGQGLNLSTSPNQHFRVRFGTRNR